MDFPVSRPAAAKAILLLLLTAPVAAGCASARQVMIRPDGGAVAVPSRTEGNMTKARELMGAHCRGPCEITLEEEVPVGSRAREETSTERDSRGRVTSTSELSFKTKYEWRIHYLCR